MKKELKEGKSRGGFYFKEKKKREERKKNGEKPSW